MSLDAIPMAFCLFFKRTGFNLSVYAHKCASLCRVLKRVSDPLEQELYIDGVN